MDVESCQAMLDTMPYARVLGIKVTHAAKDELRASLKWRQDLTTTGNILHGGVLMGFADAVGALLSFINLPPNAWTTTVESKSNFFKGSPEGADITAISRPLSVGKMLIVIQTDIVNKKGERVAQVTQTQAVLGSKL